MTCGGLGARPADLLLNPALHSNPKVTITQQAVRDWLCTIRPLYLQQRPDIQ